MKRIVLFTECILLWLHIGFYLLYGKKVRWTTAVDSCTGNGIASVDFTNETAFANLKGYLNIKVRHFLWTDMYYDAMGEFYRVNDSNVVNASSFQWVNGAPNLTESDNTCIAIRLDPFGFEMKNCSTKLHVVFKTESTDLNSLGTFMVFGKKSTDSGFCKLNTAGQSVCTFEPWLDAGEVHKLYKRAILESCAVSCMEDPLCTFFVYNKVREYANPCVMHSNITWT